VSQVWDAVFEARAWGRWPAEEVVRTVARLGRGPLTVLEVGCGPGAQLWYLAHEGHRAIGLDISRPGLDRARGRLAEEGLVARLVEGDACALPYPTAAFDLVVDVEAYAHLHEDGAAIAWAEAARVLRPGGHFLSIAFTSHTDGAGTGRAVGSRTYTDIPTGPLRGLGTVNFLDPTGAESLARRVGLEPIDCQLRSRTSGADHALVEELIFLASKPGS